MDKSTCLILDSITEGVVILDDALEMVHWNKHMESLTNLLKDDVAGKSIFEIFTKLNKEPYRNIFNMTMEKGTQYFFSSKIHKNMIVEDKYINFKISRIEEGNKRQMIMEFVDTTNEFIRVNQLKENVNELSLLNKELKAKEQEIAKLVYKDNLTNLSNRALFYSFAEKLIASAKRNGTILGVMFIDIDKFKNINDTYGHQVGDKALVQTASLLTESTRESDMVFRFGGDEFLILLPELDTQESHKKVMKRIKAASERARIKDEIKISLSMGVSLYPLDGEDIDQLVQKADQAMYECKLKRA